MRTDLSRCSYLVAGVAANIDPLPTIISRNLSPAGVIRVVIDRTAKAEREEIPVVESVVEMVVVIVHAPCKVISGAIPALNRSANRRCGHRATARHGVHTSATHHHGSSAATVPAPSRITTATAHATAAAHATATAHATAAPATATAAVTTAATAATASASAATAASTTAASTTVSCHGGRA